MTRKQQNVTLGMVAIVVAAIGFGLSQYSPAAPDNSMSRWLNLDAATAKAASDADPTFDRDAATLRETLAAAREHLAATMADADSSDAAILADVDRVIAAHGALERRVAQHVVALRSVLSAEQQQRLMSLCAQTVREGGQHRWRRGLDDADRGGGNGPGAGPSEGNGQQRRRGQGGDN